MLDQEEATAMLDTKITVIDESKKSVPRATAISTEKRSDRWSLLLVQVGENRDRKAFAQLFSHFAPLLKSFAQASKHEGWFPGLSEELVQEVMIKAVSYTHLTLPTILLV